MAPETETESLDTIERDYEHTGKYVAFYHGVDDVVTVCLDGAFDMDELRRIEIALRRYNLDVRSAAE